MTFVKGKSGNPKGAPIKEESLTGLMQQFLKQIPKGEKTTYKELFIKKCFSIAMKGDMAAMRLIWNYLEGMPPQDIKTTGELKIIFDASLTPQETEGSSTE